MSLYTQPASFSCTLHSIDLTREVIAKLTPRYQITHFHLWRRDKGRRMKFSTVVSCPGDSAEEKHDVKFVGTYVRQK